MNLSNNSPSLHIVDQKSKGRGPICKILVFLNAFTTLHTAKKFFIPLSNSGSVNRQLQRYVNGTRNLLSTFPVANNPHCESRKRIPFSSGLSSRGPHKSTGTFNSFASLATSYSVPKLPCGKNTPSTFLSLNFSAILIRSLSSCSSPSFDISSMSTNSTPSSFNLFLVKSVYFTASGAEKILLLVGANPITTFAMFFSFSCSTGSILYHHHFV